MNKTFIVTCTMNERWIDNFCSLLKYMQFCGNVGHSSLVGFFADGDGDFRPEFIIDTDYQTKEGVQNYELYQKPEIVFDAG